MVVMRMRVSKEPEERKREIMDAAEEIFSDKGFDHTAVSDIVKKVGVAQGTFYYHFSTKDEVLNAVIERFIDRFEKRLTDLAMDPALDPKEKIQLMINMTFTSGKGRDTFIRYMHSENNMGIHQRYMMKTRESLIPIATKILEDGIKQGLFDCPYPRETVELLFVMFEYLYDYSAFCDDKDRYYRMLRASEEILDRLSGAKKGTFRLIV
jgi:AcrR family transcriptional regulator